MQTELPERCQACHFEFHPMSYHVHQRRKRVAYLGRRLSGEASMHGSRIAECVCVLGRLGRSKAACKTARPIHAMYILLCCC